jgi:hypothetical protein
VKELSDIGRSVPNYLVGLASWVLLGGCRRLLRLISPEYVFNPAQGNDDSIPPPSLLPGLDFVSQMMKYPCWVDTGLVTRISRGGCCRRVSMGTFGWHGQKAGSERVKASQSETKAPCRHDCHGEWVTSNLE